MRNAARRARWIAIIACFFMAYAVQATTTKPVVHHRRKRTAHATYRTVRYARQTSSTAKRTSHTASAKKSHHYTHRRYARRSRYHHRLVLPKGPAPERITQIQSALARGGYYTGDPTGKWDAGTVAAVQKFQSANNIDASGKLDAPTLQKLGLGSDIAGVAAPRPVVPKIVGAPANGTPSGAPRKPAGSLPPSPNAGHVQSAAATSSGAQGSSNSAVAPAAHSTGANSTAANSASSNSGGGASGASAIAPSTTSTDSGASDPASASKPAADQH